MSEVVTLQMIKDGRTEVSYVDLYKRLMDVGHPLTVIERLLLAAVIKRASTTEKVLDSVVFAADLYIDLGVKQDIKSFE